MKTIDANVTIMVSDIERSIAFYENVGLNVKSRWGNNYAMMTGGGMTIGLHPGKPVAGDRSGFSLGFIVPDIKEAKSVLTKANLAFKESTDQSGYFAYTTDPDETVVYFMQPLYGKPD